MKTKASGKNEGGLTLLELIVVLFLIVILASMLLPAMKRNHGGPRITCINNLKLIGTAYRVWANDNGDKYPAAQTEELGGMKHLLESTARAGIYTYLNYSIMQNEMGQSPKVVLCPMDERPYNTNFYYGLRNAPKPSGTNWPAPVNLGTFDNTNVSYFCGVGASDDCPQSILGGDRNLGNGGTIEGANESGIRAEQDGEYGISGSVANPEYPCGADAVVNTNGRWVSAFVNGGGGSIMRGHAVGWSAKMHSAGNAAGAGNILLGDGSAQQCTSAGLRQTWLRNATNHGNFATNDTIHSANNGDIRFLFP